MTDLVDTIDARIPSNEEVEELMVEARRLHERHVREDEPSILALMQKAIAPRPVPSVVQDS